jgi:hypothetical protein
LFPFLFREFGQGGKEKKITFLFQLKKKSLWGVNCAKLHSTFKASRSDPLPRLNLAKNYCRNQKKKKKKELLSFFSLARPFFLTFSGGPGRFIE